MFQTSKSNRKLILHLALLLVSSLLCADCKLPAPIDESTLVSNMRFTPSAFDSFRRNTEMKYSLKAPARVSICIVKKDSSRQELLVKTLAEDLNETKGSHSITWIGDTDHQLFAPAGTYFGVIRIRNQRFESIVQVFHF